MVIIKIFDKDFVLKSIFTEFISIRTTDRYKGEYGDMEAVFENTKAIRNAIQQDGYIKFDGMTDRTFVIEGILISDLEDRSTVTATGRDITSLLERRILYRRMWWT